MKLSLLQLLHEDVREVIAKDLHHIIMDRNKKILKFDALHHTMMEKIFIHGHKLIVDLGEKNDEHLLKEKTQREECKILLVIIDGQ